jgi:hypothetical protein
MGFLMCRCFRRRSVVLNCRTYAGCRRSWSRVIFVGMVYVPVRYGFGDESRYHAYLSSTVFKGRLGTDLSSVRSNVGFQGNFSPKARLVQAAILIIIQYNYDGGSLTICVGNSAVGPCRDSQMGRAPTRREQIRHRTTKAKFTAVCLEEHSDPRLAQND